MVPYLEAVTKRSKEPVETVVSVTRGANLKVSYLECHEYIVHMSQMSKSINVMGGR